MKEEKKKKRRERRKKNLTGLIQFGLEDAANGSDAERCENPKAEKPPIVSLSEAAAKLDPSELRVVIEEALDKYWNIPEKLIMKLNAFYGKKLSQVPFPWLKTFNESPLSTLIHVPLSHLATSLLEISADLINMIPRYKLSSFILWSSDNIITDWANQEYVQPEDPAHTMVAHFIGLAVVLRTKPDALTSILPSLRRRPVYQGHDKLPLIVWMMAQASLGDLSAGLYSWVHNLLPLLVDNNKCCSPQSMDLILQFLDIMLSNPEAQTILVNRADRDGKRVIPPSSFEILLRLTFPDSSARLEVTERFEAVYHLLKEVALAPESSATGGNAMEEIFTFSLKLVGEGNPGLAKEAAAIALRSVTENVDCFKHWDILYNDHLEASVSLLRKLVDEWKDHSPNLLLSPGGTLTVNQAIKSFRLKNEKAITEGGANCSLYEKADKSCKLLSWRLSRASGLLKITLLVSACTCAGGVAGAALALAYQQA
ncbi:PREDICTED: uncharacterized protein LOC104784632 [Camelina sativa]|uniref:Uncharacterized protein LOC104784632 n=1 Tax=Camelina sativa TaxID=90675 RepID=A0ABM0YYM8_CAMSA|nr:PREDICTED: uncharacterized protein LOC104784632 [Camelina sativa]